MSIGRLSLVAIDCPDPSALARFYSAITGWAIVGVEVDPAGHPFCLVAVNA